MIGVFDSGVGGLSVLRQIRALLPATDLLYVADRARAPFGEKTLDEVESISHQITAWLIDRGATCVVVACNTASAAALDSLRETHPDLAIVGMEPAVKPAAAESLTGTVAVYATSATFQGRLFNSVVDRFAGGVRVLAIACPEWVELVEGGRVSGSEAERLVTSAIGPALQAGADRIVLACTHFSFLSHLIAEKSGIPVIDPAVAVAAQVARVCPNPDGDGRLTLAVSSDGGEFARLARALAGVTAPVIPFEP